MNKAILAVSLFLSFNLFAISYSADKTAAPSQLQLKSSQGGFWGR